MSDPAGSRGSELVVDRRTKRRFPAKVVIPGEFGPATIVVTEMSEGGFRIEHAVPLKIGSLATARIRNPETNETLAIHARVVWSRLSKKADEKGKFLYCSGIRVEDDLTPHAGILGRLVRSCGTVDTDSMEQRRRTLEQKMPGMIAT